MAKTITGIVSSDKANKTIVVTVQAHKTHPIYKKKYTFSRKFMAHDENNDAKEGDKVVISECKPISARKRYTLDSVIEKATIKHIEPEIVPDTTTKTESVSKDSSTEGKK